MAADESVRYRLQRKLEELVGPEEATELMASTPPFPWTELATKRDLDLLGRELRGEMRELRGELLERIGALEAKIGGVEAKIGGVEGKIGGVEAKIGGVEAKIGGVEGKMGSQTRTITLANFASVFTAVGLVLAATKLAA